MIRPAHAAACLLLAAFVTACGSGTSATVDPVNATSTPSAVTSNEPDPTEAPEATPDPTPEPTPVSQTYGVGDVITITENGDPWADFTVVEVREDAEFVDPDGFFNDTPQTDGYVYLSAKVRYEAIVSGVDYNQFDFQIFVDGQAVDNLAFAINAPEPGLSSGTLPAGRTAEGWLLYEVPPTGEVLLSYTGNMFLDEEPVFEVVLREG